MLVDAPSTCRPFGSGGGGAPHPGARAIEPAPHGMPPVRVGGAVGSERCPIKGEDPIKGEEPPAACCAVLLLSPSEETPCSPCTVATPPTVPTFCPEASRMALADRCTLVASVAPRAALRGVADRDATASPFCPARRMGIGGDITPCDFHCEECS